MWNEPKASMDPVKETIVYIKRRRICEWRKSSFLCKGRFLNKVRGSLGWNDMKFSIGKKHDYRVKKRSLLYIQYLQGFIHPRWCRISSINQIPFGIHGPCGQTPSVCESAAVAFDLSASELDLALGPVSRAEVFQVPGWWHWRIIPGLASGYPPGN